ncbi:4Fe-4S dicluster domain-containing protein [Archaeoglobus veneficus]|uniref:4Fe-4S ferredoxin iron-sulfur binding domain-containing protein n=1 Tax=Archaeoglobus veneficus (strain DSM 11195 / SNP6) TaxID=693661 RepID=F2KRJ3_ARCVS|nr:4Fe-4S dicluster domain-containing protein [Archaeoglobus veneficus]AEA46758.1 4Fe-4S ferredoxin iron-sulfur binding domain-containing protein [Archaeoglobus veneficus SNP6]
MNLNRREFIKLGLKAAVVAGGIAAVSASLSPKEKYWGFVVDLTRCIGCGKCVQACRTENKVPEGFYRTWVERYTVTEEGQVLVDSPKMGEEGYTPYPPETDISKIKGGYFVPKLCNQCENAPCVAVCPVGATYMTDDGVVLVDYEKCIGCGYCVSACPYGARYLYPEDGESEYMRGKVDKCTWCYHRVVRGLEPACVYVCPTKARVFGNVLDPNSDVRKYYRLKLKQPRPKTGADPKLYYYTG